MKKVAWVVLLAAAVGGNAMAEWVSIGDSGNAEVYVDRSTVVRKGDMATLWSVYALKAPGTIGGKSYVSLKRQDEFDCAGARARGVQIAAYPEAMAGGTAVASEKGSGAWTPVTPESGNEMLMKVACGKE